MSATMETLEGWYTLHDFRTVNWPAFLATPLEERMAILEELHELLMGFQNVNFLQKGAFGLYAIAGHKADFLWLQLRPSLEDIIEAERLLDQTRFSHFCSKNYSYVSVVELSNYVVNREENPYENPMVRGRLFPQLPNKKAICFYPMSKRREVGANWYLEPHEERRRMMHAHGMIGRSYAGQITQMIGGSIGFDDWEWGVTLFAEDPVSFKKVVTDMRFDEVSAKFGDFGAFYVGTLLQSADLRHLLLKKP